MKYAYIDFQSVNPGCGYCSSQDQKTACHIRVAGYFRMSSCIDSLVNHALTVRWWNTPQQIEGPFAVPWHMYICIYVYAICMLAYVLAKYWEWFLWIMASCHIKQYGIHSNLIQIPIPKVEVSTFMQRANHLLGSFETEVVTRNQSHPTDLLSRHLSF